MGSSPSSQPGSNSQNHTTHSNQRTGQNRIPNQSEVFVAWDNHNSGQQRTQQHVHIQRNNDTMVCEACKANFTLLKRKYLCCDCKKHYCNACSAKEFKKCRNCLLFKLPCPREKLQQMKIKDLRQYLSVRDIPTDSCREKSDLVELTFNFLNSRSTNGPTGLFQGSANISQNRSGSGIRQPPPASGTQTGSMPNSPNATDWLYNRAHQQYFGGFAGANEGRMFGTSVSSGFASSQTAQPHGPFATSQEQYSSSSSRQQSSQHSTAEETNSQGSSATETGNQQATEENSQQGQPVSGQGTANTTNETENNTQARDPPPVRRRASLKDIDKVEDIEQLTNRQLKEILAANFVDYKGCVERYELSDRVKRLYEDREGMKAKEEKAANAGEADTPGQQSGDDDLCRICMDATIDCVLLECGHMVTCTTCGKQMNECPICRQYVVRCVHIFRS